LSGRINLTGKSSNDIYTVSYPKNLLYFMKYDFNLFMERCVDLCKLYMKTGEYRQEETAEIRNSISGCHKYYEQNIRGAFEKIVIDCWVEYICRQNEIGVITLWNNYIPCRNDFEKAVFTRLSEYRNGYAINQWVNLLKIQEYANIKTDFIFGGKLKGSAEAAARANYFDLMFNVVANEQGYDLNSVAENKVFTLGRTPNSPFVMSSVSREIVRNLLADMKYADDKGKLKKGEIVSDQTAMDAFASMKALLPARGDNIVETMIKSLSEAPMKVYMPAGLKAAVDLEIDVIIESGEYLQRCELCKDFYLRSEDYDFDYCDTITKNGRTCYELMASKINAQNAKNSQNAKSGKIVSHNDSIDAALLNERCDRLYKEMSARINVEFTQRDFSDWCRYMNAIRENVLSGQATLLDFENFAEYSRSMSFLSGNSADAAGSENSVRGQDSAAKRRSRSEPDLTRLNPEKDSRGRTVKPFVFERVERRDVEIPELPVQHYAPDDDDDMSTTIPSRVSSRVIRGVHPETFSSDVTIPYASGNMPHGLIHESASPQIDEEDVKIYNVRAKSIEPVKQDEYVKVFKPKKASRTVHGSHPSYEAQLLYASQVTAHSAQPPQPSNEPQLSPVYPVKPLNIPPAVSESVPERRNNRHIPAFSDISAAKEGSKESPREVPRENPILRDIPRGNSLLRDITPSQNHAKPSTRGVTFGGDNSFEEEYNSAPALSLNIPKLRDRQADGDYSGEPEDSFSSKVYASQKAEETQEIGFTDILRGLERKDGFTDESIPTDAEGVPLSHKTKRVMDAIFKQPKSNLFINSPNEE